MLIEIGAFFADESVIPGGGFVPGGVGGGSAGAVGPRWGL